MMFPFKLVFFNILSIFGSWRNIQKNSKYHSAFPPPVPAELPPVCVQMPVYKESFDETILPSLISIYRAIDYYTAMGGDAHMFVNDDGLQLIDEKEREERIRFYHENEIAYIARPSHDILKRHGLFKKASNMNFCLNFAIDVQKAEEEFGLSKQEAIQHVIDARPYPVLAGGPIGIGTVEYVLLVDSDTRVPEKCLYQTVGEFVITPTLGFIQHTMSVLRVGNNYWEEMLAHWTWTLYNLFIPMGTANGEPAPLVGHNATLNWRLVKEVSTFDEEVNYRKFWSESHVSEDFDLSLRLQSKGYIGRYAMYCGMGFQEGVSLTVFDEIIKLKKFAYGAGEMMFNKFRYWCWKGPFAPLIIDYLRTKEIPLAARVNMVAYFFTFFAMAWGVLFLPLSFFLSTITPYEQVMATAWENYIGVMLSFLVVGTAGTIVLKFLMGIYGSLWAAFIDEIWRAPLIAVFYAGVQWHMFTGFFRYMFDMKAEWGATVKELDDTDISFKTFYTEVKNTVKAYWFMYLFPVLGQMSFFIWFYMFGPEHIKYNGYVLAPFFSFIGAHFLMPILLNPNAMRCVFGWIPGVLCCWCRRREAADMKKKMNNKEYNTLDDSISIGKTGRDDLDQMELGATQNTISNTESADEDNGHRAMTPMETFLVKEKIKAGGGAADESSGDLISGYATPDEKEPPEMFVVEDQQNEDEPKQEEPSPAEVPSEDVVESTPPAAETDDASPSEQEVADELEEPSEQEVDNEQEEQVTTATTEPKSTSETVENPTPAEPKDEVVAAAAEIQEKDILPTSESPTSPVPAVEEIPKDAPLETEDEEKKELFSGDDDKKVTTSINDIAVVEPMSENADTQMNHS
uniref:Glycosyltransferase 2-like domain-containing protein n=1 Tax=Asterionellopsis glacialis TaxID=33640 RepID=A0A7S0PX07_9STRA